MFEKMPTYHEALAFKAHVEHECGYEVVLPLNPMTGAPDLSRTKLPPRIMGSFDCRGVIYAKIALSGQVDGIVRSMASSRANNLGVDPRQYESVLSKKSHLRRLFEMIPFFKAL